jgi:hypothetical protein
MGNQHFYGEVVSRLRIELCKPRKDTFEASEEGISALLKLVVFF